MRYNGEACVTDTTGSGITCPGAPRSIYASIPWGIIDIDTVYRRTLSYNISSTPYAQWQTNTTKLNTLTLELADLTGINIAKSRETQALNPFFGPPGSYPAVSLIDVLSMSRTEFITNFSGKYVLIGESGTLIHDSFVSPVTGTQIDGVETHAHFLDGLLQNKMLTRIDSTMMFAALILLTLICVLLYFLLPNYLSPIVAIVMMA